VPKKRRPKKPVKAKGKPPHFARLLRQAECLTSISGREAEFYRVVVLALKFGEPRVALEAASRLTSISNRELAHWMVFSHFLLTGRRDEAEGVISLLTRISNRERAHRALLRVGGAA
jgi:hypothetical protein